MLPPRVRENSQRATSLVMDERFGGLRESIEEINRDYSARGLGQSGVRIGAIEKALSVEAVIMADAIWRSIREVYESVGGAADESHRADLKSLFDESFRHPETALPQTLESQARLTPLPGNLAAHGFSDAMRQKFSHLRNKATSRDRHVCRQSTAPDVTASVRDPQHQR